MPRIYLPVHIDGAAASGQKAHEHVCVGRGTRLVGVIISGDAINQHASNYADFNVYGDDDVTLLWNRDTDTNNDGSLVDGQAEGVSPDYDFPASRLIPLEQAGEKLDVAAGDTYLVECFGTGTGVVVDVVITLILETTRSLG